MQTSRDAQIALIDAIKADAPIQILLDLERIKISALKSEGGPHEIYALPAHYRKGLISLAGAAS